MKALGQLVAGLDLGAVDLFAAAGVGMLFAGLWLTVGLGIALAAVGGLVLALALAIPAAVAAAEARAEARKAAAARRAGG